VFPIQPVLQGYLLPRSPECVTVCFAGPLGEEVVEQRGMLGLKRELERWGVVEEREKKEKVEQGKGAEGIELKEV